MYKLLLFICMLFSYHVSSFADKTTSGDQLLIISIDTISGKTESKIPVRFTNVPQSGISSCNIKIIYNPEQIYIKTIQPGSIVKNAEIDFTSNFDSENNFFVMLFIDETQMDRPITDDGVFAYINIDIVNHRNSFCLFQLDTIQSAFADNDLNQLSYLHTNGGISINNTTVAKYQNRSHFADRKVIKTYCRIKGGKTVNSHYKTFNLRGTLIKNNRSAPSGFEIRLSGEI